ncbi:hypothetical protein [Sneathiella aquimaris]|uniref:hypothetical protein n=1 Tax=Sneathiella aquimaris TaxID=2599305 RepID=UPI00146D96B5|nr:hypothetical protein [Sneathiella aquimaris]
MNIWYVSEAKILWISAVIVCALLLPLSQARALSAGQCRDTYKTPEIRLLLTNAKTALITNKSSSQIKRIANRTGAFKPTTAGQLRGLTYTNDGYEFSLKVQGRKLADGRYCVRLTQIDFKYGMREAQIFIDRKYKPGSCNFKVILAHEQEHMKINMAVQKNFTKMIDGALRKIADRLRPVISGSVQRAADSMENSLYHDLKPVIREFQKQKRKANLKIDTPKSYQQVQSRCAGW